MVKQIIVIGDTSYHIGNVDLCLGESTQIGIMPNPGNSRIINVFSTDLIKHALDLEKFGAQGLQSCWR